MLRIELFSTGIITAKITIHTATNQISLEKRSAIRYEFGKKGSPRYRIHLPQGGSDEPWGLDFIEHSSLFSSGDFTISGPEKRELEKLASVFPGIDCAIISQLPEGEYFMCEFRESGTFGHEMCMGNFIEDMPCEALKFGASHTLTLSAFGQQKRSRVALGQVLVGVTLLDFTGTRSGYRGVWFFNLIEGDQSEETKRAVVVIPLSGQLVLGYFCSTQRNQDVEYRTEALRWKNEATHEIEKAFSSRAWSSS